MYINYLRPLHIRREVSAYGKCRGLFPKSDGARSPSSEDERSLAAARAGAASMTAHAKSAEIEARPSIAGQKAINLALQGGGNHSAFTWGVLDRLLEDDRLSFDGITATSAGCFNAVLIADGLASGGRAAAKICC